MFSTPLQETPAQRAQAFTAQAQSFAVQAAIAQSETGRAYYENQAAKYLRFAAFASSQSAPVAAIAQPEPVAAPASLSTHKAQIAAPKAQPVRSERVQAMRRFYAIASEHKLSTKNAEAMTVALSKYLGVVIPSRASLSAGHWSEAAAAVQLGMLAF